MPGELIDDVLWRFLLEDTDVCGAVIRLGSAWRKLTERRAYPVAVERLLGETAAIGVLLAGSLKEQARLTIQVRGQGPVSLLVIDCNEQLHIRGVAKYAQTIEEAPAPALLGNGQLLLALDLPSAREPYRSIVPLSGGSMAEIFENYLEQSDQAASRFHLAVSPDRTAGLFLQKLPTADQRDPDGWARITALASTLTSAELLTVPTDELLSRLFHEESVRLFPARSVACHCPEDWEKVRSMLRLLGRDEVYATLHEQGEVVIMDDLCNREYRFDRQAVDDLFRVPGATAPPTWH